jgi:hypothetical protein
VIGLLSLSMFSSWDYFDGLLGSGSVAGYHAGSGILVGFC